ncbi:MULTISPECIES: PAS domain S-box protein [unclassified Archaeoglobus]|jgi:two-component system response regulator|uniref:PAS domain S-box protein n=1 Tax=unclassified Archaeoglobus TaxID=2643606 RepID=UPI0025C0DF9D|nr:MULTISPECIES: PAS domain S-box protein [unclassified Archaeoglobus]
MDINIDFIPDPVIVTDKGGRILALNTSASELGLSGGANIHDYIGKNIAEIEIDGRSYEIKISETTEFNLYILRDITERKEVERKLKESENMYRTLVELSPDAIVVHDGQKIVFANRRAAELSGFEKPEEMVGLPIMNFVHPDYVDLVRERISRMMKNRTIAPFVEEKFVLPDGSVRDVEVSVSFITFNEKPAILLVVRDVTERKRMEEEVIESERKYKDFFHNTLDIIVVTDLRGNYVEVNKEFERITGYSRDEILGKNFRDVLPKKEADYLFKKYNEAFRERKSVYGLEFKFTTRFGETKYVEGKVRPLIKKDRVVGFIANFKDITERKKLEEELRRTNKLLKTINHINELVVREKDLQKLIEMTVKEIGEYSNHAWIGIYRDGHLNPIGTSGIDIKTVRQEIEKGMLCVEKAAEMKKPVVVYKNEHRPKCPNFNAHKEYNCYIFPIVYHEKLVGIMTIHSDIRISDEEVKLLQTLADNIAFAINSIELEKMKEQAVLQIDRNIEQFAILVDKIRNPLAVIIGAVEVGCDNYDIQRKVFEAVNKVESIIAELERGWLESEDVRKLLRGMRDEDTSG